MTDLKALLERVKAATGQPDRDLDAAIFAALPPFDAVMTPDPKWSGRVTFDNFGPDSRTAPFYTISVDAALALVERVLPGAYGAVPFGLQPIRASIIWDNRRKTALGNTIVTSNSATGEGATPPLAIVAALLTALIAKDAQQ